MSWPGFNGLRFDSIMGRQKPYIDESGAIGQSKRFQTGTTPSWEEQFRPHQSQAEAQPNPWEQREQPSEGGSYYDELERIRTNRGPALSAYQKALGEQPTWEQHKPSWKRRLAGALISASSAAGGDDTGRAVALGQSVVRSPYDTARSEYTNRMKNLGASAKLEQDEIEAQLQSLKEARALGLKYDEYKLKQLENEQQRRYQEGQLANQGRTAATGERNARTNEFDANTRRFTAEESAQRGDRTLDLTETRDYNQERNIDSMIQDRLDDNKVAREAIAGRITAAQARAGNRNPSPASNQQGAIDNAVRMLARDGRFARYFDMGDPAAPAIKGDDKSPGYIEMMRELQTITERQLFKGTPFGEPPATQDIPINPGIWER